MQQTSQDSTSSQTRRAGVVIACLGLQLLLCSIASAANAAGDSIDRSARRLPAQVAQALREIVDRSNACPQGARAEPGQGFALGDTPLRAQPPVEAWVVVRAERRWGERELNLPPPALG